MEKWNALYLKNLKKFEDELHKEYAAKIKKAGDREFVHNEFSQKIIDILNKELNTDNIPYRGQIYTIIREIIDMQKRDRTLDFDSAFDKITIGYAEKEKIIILNKTSKIEAYKMVYSELPHALEQIKANVSMDDMLNSFVMGFPTVENDETIIIPISKSEPEQINSPPIEEKNEATLRQQVLAMYYLLDEFKACTNADKTAIARFIQFLTGKQTTIEEIKNTNIYKYVNKPFNSDEKALKKDLLYIRNYFEKAGLNNIVKVIDADLESK